MKLAFISNIKDIKNISKYGTIDFALTRQLNNKYYFNYFKNSKKNIILDCNVHEEDNFRNWDEYVEMAIKIKAKYIICPDELRDANKTLINYKHFINKYYKILKKNKIKIIGVPQGKTLKEINFLFKIFNTSPYIGMIGNSFDLKPLKFTNNKIINQTLNRQYLVNNWLKNIKKPIHLLGCNGVYEIFYYQSLNNKFINSMDSKLMLRLAKSNILFNKNNFIKEGWKYNAKSKIDFNEKLTKTTIINFKYNVNFLKNMGYL